MAKRKRASLKDKSSESLGLTQKKGKGLDLLFGGSVEQEEGASVGQVRSGGTQSSDLSGIDDSGPSLTASASTGIPTGAEGLVDELGLPVALEAPPDDLILASPSDDSSGGEVDPTVLGPTGSQTGANNDLSGILGEANSPIGEEENLSSSFDENDLSGLVEEGSSTPTAGAEDLAGNDLSGLADDLSGLVGGDSAGDLSSLVADEAGDLSGLVVDDTAQDDLSGLVVEDAAADDPSGMAPTPIPDLGVPGSMSTEPPPPTFAPMSPPPPTTAAPISVPPAAPAPTFQPAPTPTFPAVGTTPTFSYPPLTSPPPGPVSNIPPPSTATGAPSMSAPRPAGIRVDALDNRVVETVGALGAVIGDSPEDFRFKDLSPDQELTIRERERVERDDAITEKVLRYVGTERRDALFKEIETLHDTVAQELNGNKADVSFALDTLREANNIVIEDPRQYDEALYRVAMVKTMLYRKHNLTKSSYTLGFIVFAYGIVFTILCALGYFVNIDFGSLLNSEELGSVFKAVWFSGLAGGLGGSVEILWRLYYRVSIKQNFDPQYMMYYLVKPVLGFVLGLVMYFLIAVGTAIGGAAELPQAGSTAGFTLSILLGFIAGYRQESVFDMIYVLVNKISPDNKKGGGASSVVPVDEATIAANKTDENTDYAATSS